MIKLIFLELINNSFNQKLLEVDYQGLSWTMMDYLGPSCTIIVD